MADTIADLDAQIVDLLSIFGTSVTWERRSSPTYNTGTGAVGSTDVPLVVNALVQPQRDEQMPTEMEMIPIRFVFRSADLSSGIVAVGDYVVYGGKNYEVFAVTIPVPGAVQNADTRLT